MDWISIRLYFLQSSLLKAWPAKQDYGLRDDDDDDDSGGGVFGTLPPSLPYHALVTTHLIKLLFNITKF